MANTIMTVKLGHHDDLALDFALEKHPIAELWLRKMQMRHHWPLDNPDRFYGFDDIEVETDRALAQVKHCVDRINDFVPLIDRDLKDVRDQDTLNYLHNIFEVYHGQLDQQHHEIWKTAPQLVRSALADLNLAVHRCESLRSGQLWPRMVCTWFGMPKSDTLALDLQDSWGHETSQFGAVYLNYVEIGKTVLEMAEDNDHYMSDHMFQPFTHYSADFRVDFFDDSVDRVQQRRKKTSDYFNRHRDFFRLQGIHCSEDVRVRPIKFKVAQLLYESQDREHILSLIRNRQWVATVTLT